MFCESEKMTQAKDELILATDLDGTFLEGDEEV